MTRELIIEPEAELEITEAAGRYEARNPRLGAEFIRAVEDALGTIQRNPYQYQAVFGKVHRVLLRRFSYALMYIVSE
jgi:plasmid stabilization system protein ParE